MTELSACHDRETKERGKKRICAWTVNREGQKATDRKKIRQAASERERTREGDGEVETEGKERVGEDP